MTRRDPDIEIRQTRICDQDDAGCRDEPAPPRRRIAGPRARRQILARLDALLAIRAARTD